MHIDKNKIYEVGKYTYQNFTTLSEEQIKQVWEWRNHSDIRKYMYNKEIIPFENHLQFIGKLSNRDDISYWLAFYEGQPIGVTNLVDINYQESSAEMGSYMVPEMMSSGMGLDFFYHNLKLTFSDFIDCNFLHGSIHRKNLNALLLDSYLGFEMNHDDIQNPEAEYVRITYYKKDFKTKQIDCEDIVKYVEYIKQNKKYYKL